MKKSFILLILAFVYSLSMQAQGCETDIAKTLSQDEIILSFYKDEAGKVSDILTSGNIKLNSYEGYVRTLTADQYEYDPCTAGAQNQMNYGKYHVGSAKKEMRINVSNLSPGIYIVTVMERNGNTKETAKFVKE